MCERLVKASVDNKTVAAVICAIIIVIMRSAYVTAVVGLGCYGSYDI
jgi:hypothetical protein